MENNRVLIADDELYVRRLLWEVTRKAGYEAILAENGLEALEKARQYLPAVIILDIRMPVMDGMEAFTCIRSELPDSKIILLTAHGTVENTLAAMKQGAFDYLVKPANVAEVRTVMEQAFRTRRLVIGGAPGQAGSLISNSTTIIGKSAAIRNIFKAIGRIAATNATVLLTGESGSGKEVFAKLIHENSSRANGPFIKANCGAMPEGLMESEFFGYEKGAFTGAVGRKPGRFELADQGTLLLDEIGELPPGLQVKLLRAIQEREFERVGGTETIKVNVRIIAATNRDLKSMVRQGSFREDLFYRLNVVPLHIPPLRERREDIPLFAEYFVNRFAAEMLRPKPVLTAEALHYLCAYSWPGNVRQLANTIERAVILSQGVIQQGDLQPGDLLPVQQQMTIDPRGTLKEIMSRAEREVIEYALRINRGNRLRTAQMLGISRRALFYKIDEYRLTTPKEDADESLEAP